jgi:hypothetical protein
MIYPFFYIFYHKAKWWLDDKNNAIYIWRPTFKFGNQQMYMDHMLTYELCINYIWTICLPYTSHIWWNYIYIKLEYDEFTSDKFNGWFTMFITTNPSTNFINWILSWIHSKTNSTYEGKISRLYSPPPKFTLPEKKLATEYNKVNVFIIFIQW